MAENRLGKVEIAFSLKAQDWPLEDLERVERCPVCGSSERTMLHDDLWDASFLCAPGRWQLWACDHCRSAYLDPRPNAFSIGRAYENYYTHASPVQIEAPHTTMLYIRRALANGYRNWRYGGKLEPSWAIGALLSSAFSNLRRSIDYKYRYLPRPKVGARVLDVGCGSGEWLAMAATSGWEPHGLDLDPRCVGQARQRGLRVNLGTIETYEHALEAFDAITMSHVIEHVDNPPYVLRRVFDLLRPGGTLYLDTPNIDAPTHHQFGRHWRGLETPRHFVIFNPDSIESLLGRIGFENIQFHPAPGAREYLIETSQEMRDLDDPEAKHDEHSSAGIGSEFITVTCNRPLRRT